MKKSARLRVFAASAVLLGGGMVAVSLAAPGAPSVAPIGYTNDSTPSISWTPGGGGSGTFDYSLDGETGTTDATSLTPSLGDGEHTFSVTERPTEDDPDPSNSAAGVITFTVDTDAPDASVAFAPRADPQNGWYGADALPIGISASCQAGGSPVTGPSLSRGAITGDFTGTVTATCSDAAGNSDSATTGAIKVDATAPVLSRALQGTPGANGWYTSPVLVNYTCSDATSGVASCPNDFTVTDDVSDLQQRQIEDRAGNPSNVLPFVAGGVKSDTIDPLAVVSAPTPAQGAKIELGTDAPAVRADCGDGGPSGLASCVATLMHTGDGPVAITPGTSVAVPGLVLGMGAAPLGNRTLRIVATDGAGNVTTVDRTFAIVDTTAPSAPTPGSPGAITNLLQPTFSWQASTDAGTGVVRYDLKIDGRASIAVPATVGEVSYKLTGAAGANAALSPGQHTWTVTAVDAAGNRTATATQTFRVDPTAPDAPAITDGPRGFTRVTTPTFRYSGLPTPRFTWTLEKADCTETQATPTACDVQGPTADATGTAALGALTDGSYRFKVSQANDAGTVGAEAVALFTVDTTKPAALKVTSSPGATADQRPSFGWTGGEAGATYRWMVTGPGGAVVQGPGSVAATSLRLPAALPGGAYVFLVKQIDQAGNEGDWSAPEPFTVIGPGGVGGTAAGGDSPGGGGVRTTSRPKTVNARALTPRAGVVLKTLTPTLSWKRYPKATLYNVQIFRVRGGGSVKVLSAFPRGTRFVIPRGKLVRGQRYVWRVWPYLGRVRRYTRTQLGTSYFDVSRTAKAPRTAPRRR